MNTTAQNLRDKLDVGLGRAFGKERAALKPVREKTLEIQNLKILAKQMLAAGEDPLNDPAFVREWDRLGQPSME